MSTLNIYRKGLLVGYHDFRDFWTLRSWLCGWMLRILTNAFAWVLLGQVVGSNDKLYYLVVGNAVAVGSAAALWASNATTWSRYDGTHPLLVIAPGSLLAAVVGRTSIWLLNGIATSAFSFIALFAAFGFRVSLLQGVIVFGVIALVCGATFSFALFLGTLLSNRVRYRNLVLDITGMTMLALCGASVPIEFWPKPVQWGVQLLPMTHGLLAIRGSLASASATAVLRQIGLEVAVGAAWLTISLLTMRRLFNAGRADGSIELL